jgi:hypothetical protein
MRNLSLPIVAAALFAVSVTAKADVFVGLPADFNAGNCYPFGCAYNGEYQQVYASNQFSSPVVIIGLEFFNTQVDFGATSLNSGNWAISLSTTGAAYNTLSPNFASNIGGNNTLVFTGDLGQPWGFFGYPLVINFSTPFSYDPSAGNLLMDVNVTGATLTDAPVFFDVSGNYFPNTIMGRVFETSGGSAVEAGYGLVTDFVTQTPEPSFYVVLPGSILALAALVRRRRRQAC